MIDDEIKSELTTEWQSTTLLWRKVGYQYTDFVAALHALQEQGEIEVFYKGTPGKRKRMLWRLPKTQETTGEPTAISTPVAAAL